jgi:lactobin A/cerein 7B family class IIb bacteriocin
MNELTVNELQTISGGGLSWAAIFGMIAGGIFLIGVLDGYLRPYSCRG